MSNHSENGSGLSRRALLRSAAAAGLLAAPVAGMLSATGSAANARGHSVADRVWGSRPDVGANGSGEIRVPQGVSVDRSGSIVVVDELHRGVEVFDANGGYRFELVADDGALEGENYPFDSVVDSQGRFLVLNHHRVQVFEPDGSFAFAFGTHGKGEGHLSGPSGLAVDSRDNVIVADSASHQMKVFDRDGNFRFEFGSLGSDPGRLSSPLSVAVNSNDDIIVTDNHHRVQVFDRFGNYLWQFGSLGSGPGEFSFAFGVAVDQDDRIIVVDSGNNRFQVFDPAGQFLWQAGSLGVDSGQLNFPSHVAVASDNSILVADSGNKRVQVFGPDGGYQRSFGNPERTRDSEGAGLLGQHFDTRVGLTVDKDDNVLVAHTTGHAVWIFDPEHTLIGKIGGLGTGEGEFNIPFAAATDSRGRIFVADAGNHRVQVFSPAPEGAFQFAFGGIGSGDGQFSNIAGIAADSQDRIIVSDAGTSRIQVFSPDGNFLFGFGSPGTDEGQFSGYILNVATGIDDRIIATDGSNHRVQVFDANGEFMFAFGSFGTDPGQFQEPAAVATDDAGNMFVADVGNGRVQVFDSAGQEVGILTDACCEEELIGPGRLLVTDAHTGQVEIVDPWASLSLSR